MRFLGGGGGTSEARFRNTSCQKEDKSSQLLLRSLLCRLMCGYLTMFQQVTLQLWRRIGRVDRGLLQSIAPTSVTGTGIARERHSGQPRYEAGDSRMRSTTDNHSATMLICQVQWFSNLPHPDNETFLTGAKPDPDKRNHEIDGTPRCSLWTAWTNFCIPFDTMQRLWQIVQNQKLRKERCYVRRRTQLHDVSHQLPPPSQMLVFTNWETTNYYRRKESELPLASFALNIREAVVFWLCLETK